jgi:hypothetical protein
MKGREVEAEQEPVTRIFVGDLFDARLLLTSISARLGKKFRRCLIG